MLGTMPLGSAYPGQYYRDLGAVVPVDEPGVFTGEATAGSVFEGGATAGSVFSGGIAIFSVYRGRATGGMD